MSRSLFVISAFVGLVDEDIYSVLHDWFLILQLLEIEVILLISVTILYDRSLCQLLIDFTYW